MTTKKSIGFVGAGNMAEAMIRGLLRGKVFAPGHVTASAPREERQRELSEKYGIRVTADNREAAAQSIVVLSVKPQILGRVLDEMPSMLGRGPTVRAALAVPTVAISIKIATTKNATCRRDRRAALRRRRRGIETGRRMNAMGRLRFCGNRRSFLPSAYRVSKGFLSR